MLGRSLLLKAPLACAEDGRLDAQPFGLAQHVFDPRSLHRSHFGLCVGLNLTPRFFASQGQ